MKEMMAHSLGKESSVVYGGCVFSIFQGFSHPYGGFGTFFNEHSLQQLSHPIHCNVGEKEPPPYSQHVCSTLQKNRVGELSVFEQGDSVLEIFYKFAGLQNYCMHSDWLVGYMVSNYCGGLQNIVPGKANVCQRDPCTLKSVTCHNQTPLSMAEFTLAHSQAK